MEKYLILLILLLNIIEDATSCTVMEVKKLKEGCNRLIGLSLNTAGGTVVNDHNCNILLPKQVFTEEPTFKYDGADSSKFYTLLMLDMLMPSTDGAFFLHMMKSNIPGLALNILDSKLIGIEFRGYKPPTPPMGSGIHTYVVLLYEQKDGNNFMPNVPQSRNIFSLSEWLQGKELCGPVAGIQFRTQY